MTRGRRRGVAALTVLALTGTSVVVPASLGGQPNGLKGYEGQPGNQGGHGGTSNGLQGYEGQPGNQGGH